MNIRQAVLEDAATIAEFNSAMALETEDLTLERNRIRAGVEAVLADDSKGFYLVAETDGTLIGQLMVTYEWSDWRNGVFWWIQSVYVRPGHRGQGVYKSLYAATQSQAAVAGNVCGIRLYVEHENERAQRTYERLGMKNTSYHLYEVDFVIKR